MEPRERDEEIAAMDKRLRLVEEKQAYAGGMLRAAMWILGLLNVGAIAVFSAVYHNIERQSEQLARIAQSVAVMSQTKYITEEQEKTAHLELASLLREWARGQFVERKQ